MSQPPWGDTRNARLSEQVKPRNFQSQSNSDKCDNLSERGCNFYLSLEKLRVDVTAPSLLGPRVVDPGTNMEVV